MDTDSAGDVIVGRPNGSSKTTSEIKLRSVNTNADALNFPEICVMLIG
jgi:hypothetical protein